MEDCIFCKIVAGKIPAERIFEDEKSVVFLDIMPANKGHCLAAPKKHTETLAEMSDDDMLAMMRAAKKAAKALSLSFGNKGFNLVMNNGKEAGQLVNHAHMHIIPRFAKDRLRIKWSHQKYETDEIKQFADSIRKFI